MTTHQEEEEQVPWYRGSNGRPGFKDIPGVTPGPWATGFIPNPPHQFDVGYRFRLWLGAVVQVSERWLDTNYSGSVFSPAGMRWLYTLSWPDGELYADDVSEGTIAEGTPV